MEEKYFMIVWECVESARTDEISLRKENEKVFCSKIKNLFQDQNHKTRIKNTCIIKTSSSIEEIRFEIAKLLISNSDFGAFGAGCYFEVHVLQMDSLSPVLPVKN